MGGSNDKPDAPQAVTSTYENGFGGRSTTTMNGNNQSTTYAPSAFENQQYDYYKGVTPQLQNRLFDQNTADSQATAYADNIKAQGLKRFGIDQADVLGGAQASNASRFGSLNNSDYDSQMKTFARESNSGLADINSQYETNKTNFVNDYNNRNINLLGAANGIYNNTNTNANNMNNGSMTGYQNGNAFNQTNYSNALGAYNAKLAQNNNMFGGLSSVLGNSQLTGAMGNGIGAAGSWLRSLGGEAAGAAGTEALSYAPELAMMLA